MNKPNFAIRQHRPNPKREVLAKKIKEDFADHWEQYGMPALHHLLLTNNTYPEPLLDPEEPWLLRQFGIREERSFYAEENILRAYKEGRIPVWGESGAAEKIRIICNEDQEMFSEIWGKLGAIYFQGKSSMGNGRPPKKMTDRWNFYYQLLKKEYPGIGKNKAAEMIVEYLEDLGLGSLAPTLSTVRGALKEAKLKQI